MLRRALPAVLLAIPSVAWASAGETGDLTGVVRVLVALGAIWLVAHTVVDRLQRRFLFGSGFEYILLGVLFGPAVPQVGVFSDLASLAPLIALVTGWIGLVYGTELDLRRLMSQGDVARLVGFEAVGTGLSVMFAAHAFFRVAFPGEPGPDAWMSAGVMGCAAAAGSSSAVDLVARRYGVKGHVLDLLRREARLSDLVALIAFGLLFCVFHQGGTMTSRPLTPTEWGAITVALGVALGGLFTVFLGGDDSPNGRFLALVGIVTFASGAAFFLHLAALLVCVLVGVVLANVERDRKDLRDTFARTSRPMSLILLVFAGALWEPPAVLPAIAAAVGLVLMRLVTKLAGGYVASVGTDLRGDLARGLLAQGDVAIAMVVAYRLVYSGPTVDVACTAILASVIVYELAAPRALKGLLVDAGEVLREIPDV
jgi:hypothetical protein